MNKHDPKNSLYTTAWLHEAVLEMARRAKEKAAAQKAEKEAHVQHMQTAIEVAQEVPVTDELARHISTWWAQLPTALRRPEYTITEVIALAGLKGRFRKKASPIWAGRALRKLGWTPYRNEKVGYARSRLWIPPQSTQQPTPLQEKSK